MEDLAMKTFFYLQLTIFSLLFSMVRAQDTVYIPQDYPTIQQGIDAALDWDIVLVDTGTYLENINFLGKAITVASHFLIDGDTNHINNTIIDGSDPVHPDSASAVMFISGEDTTSVICGFTIKGGTGLLDASTLERLGGGIACMNAGAKICHNKIIENEVVAHQSAAIGAGIACIMYLQSKWIVIEHNVIADNHNHAVNVPSYGGGIFIGENTGTNIELRARVSHNTIENNSCYSDQQRADGGGIRIEGSDGVSTIIDFNHNLVRNNYIRGSSTRGAGFCGIMAGADITNNVFSGNYIDTTSVQFRGSAICFKFPYHWVNIVNNEISNNISPIANFDCTGAVSILDGDDIPVVVEKNIFTNNEANHGAGFYSRATYNLSVSNNIFSGNSAFKGAALASYHHAGYTLNRPLIVNNTFFGNSATDRGGAISFIGELNAPIILNCIFWENEAPLGKDVRNESGLALVVAYSDIDPVNISGSWTGEGNIHEDPLFLDPENGNYCIDSCGSPCAAAGIDSILVSGTWYYAPNQDLRGLARPNPAGSPPDMGAYEVDLCVGVDELNTQHSKLNIQIYPNPTGGISHFAFHISQYQWVTLRIYDLHGREMAEVLNQKLPAGEHLVRYDMSGLPAGVYVVELRAKGLGHRAEGVGHRVVGKVVKMD
ncbi:MAG: right-handed parallel beta-helix repeat-containing protein [Bacteroidales bacterium]